MIFFILDEYLVVAFYRHSLAHDEFTVDHGLNVSTKNVWNDNFHEINLTISNTFQILSSKSMASIKIYLEHFLKIFLVDIVDLVTTFEIMK